MKNVQKPLIIFATIEEAGATLSQNHAIQVEIGLYSCKKADILISGIGPYAAHSALLKLIDNYQTIINAGIVGSLRDSNQVGDLCTIKSIHFHHWHPEGALQLEHYKPLDPISLQSCGATLITVEKPLYQKSLPFDLVDMEAYPIASLCKQKNRKCHFVKIVSDFVNENTIEHIRQQLPLLSIRLFEELETEIHKSVSH